jgi:hypothetical protein
MHFGALSVHILNWLPVLRRANVYITQFLHGGYHMAFQSRCTVRVGLKPRCIGAETVHDAQVRLACSASILEAPMEVCLPIPCCRGTPSENERSSHSLRGL